MTKLKAFRYLLIVFLVLMFGKASVLTLWEMGEDAEATLKAYPQKTYEQLISERDSLMNSSEVIGQPEDHAQWIISADLWQGSAGRFNSENCKNFSSASQECQTLRRMLTGIPHVKERVTQGYLDKYRGIAYSSTQRSRAMFAQHRNWEYSIRVNHPFSSKVKQSWLLLVPCLLVGGFFILLTALLEQGVLWPVAMRYSAYGVVSLFTFGGGAIGFAPSTYGQAPAPAKVKKEKKDKSGSAKQDGEVSTKGTVFDPKLKYFSIEAFASPQSGGGQIELSPEWVFSFGKVKGVELGGYGFMEVRKDPNLTFFRQNLNATRKEWGGLQLLSTAGTSGKRSYASFGAGISVKKSAIKKIAPGLTSLDINYLHGYGAAAKNEVVVSYGSRPIPLSGKLRLVLAGFYRIRDIDSINRNYGQPQVQLSHTSLKNVAFVYEAETKGKSINHLFGIKLFLK